MDEADRITETKLDPRDNFWLNNDDVYGNDFLVEESDDLGLSPEGECAILP